MTSKQPILFHASRALLAGLVLLLAGCGSLLAPGETLKGPLPPAPPGTARLVIYRSADYDGEQAMPVLYLNGAAAATTQDDAVLYRDVAPGNYTITVAPTLPFPNQFKTVSLKAGDVVYVQIGSLVKEGDMDPGRTYEDTFIVSIVDQATGAYRTWGLHLIPG